MEQKQIHIPYGLISGIAMVIVGVSIYLAGFAFVKGMQYVAYLPLLVGVILNGMAFSKANDGYVTFGNIFGSCFKMSMIVTIVMVAWGLLSLYILPEMKDKAIEMARAEMAKNPNMTDEMMDMSINMMKKYYNVFMVAGSVFGSLVAGAIFSLIAAAIAPKKGERPFAPGEDLDSLLSQK